MMLCAAWALDIECLVDSRKAEELVLFEHISKKSGLVPVETIFAVSPLTPATPVEETSSITSLLQTVCALMLRTMELSFGTNLCLEILVQAQVVVRSRTS